MFYSMCYFISIKNEMKVFKILFFLQVSDFLSGAYANTIDHVTVIDCRYPCEYHGGHIEGTVNLYTKAQIQAFLEETVTSSSRKHVIIFHCEFSSERGPKMYRHLRGLDREAKQDSYPRLNFPEV